VAKKKKTGKGKNVIDPVDLPGLQGEIRIKVKTLYALQKNRIQAELRIQALVRAKILTDFRSHSLHFWLNEHVLGLEKTIEKDVALLVKDFPIWKQWLKSVHGVGPRLAGSFIAGIGDIARFSSISALTAYCGYDVRDYCQNDKCGKPIVDSARPYAATLDKKELKGYCSCEKPNIFKMAPYRKQGYKANWHQFLRMSLYKLGESFQKQDPDKCLYTRLLLQKKAFYRQQHPEWQFCYKCGAKLLQQDGLPDKCSKKGCAGNHGGIKHPFKKDRSGDPVYIYSKGHLQMMARRYACKIFLQHLWLKWREIEGLAVSEPWILAHGGHVNFIAPE